MTINNTHQLVPADVVYACDGKWWDRYQADVTAPARWTQDEGAAKRYGINYIKGEPKQGLSLTPGTIHLGSNGGYQGINLAYHLGATRVALLGYDMQYTGGQSHWHGDHPAGMNNPVGVDSWIPNFNRLARDCDRAGLAVVNLSRTTALECFKKENFDEWLQRQG